MKPEEEGEEVQSAGIYSNSTRCLLGGVVEGGWEKGGRHHRWVGRER